MAIRDKSIHKRRTWTVGRLEKAEGISEFQCWGKKLRALSLWFWSLYVCDSVPAHGTILRSSQRWFGLLSSAQSTVLYTDSYTTIYSKMKLGWLQRRIMWFFQGFSKLCFAHASGCRNESKDGDCVWRQNPLLLGITLSPDIHRSKNTFSRVGLNCWHSSQIHSVANHALTAGI